MSTGNSAAPGPGKSSSGPGSSASSPAQRRVIPADQSLTSAGSWASTLLYCVFAFGMFWFALKVWRDLVPILITGFFALFGVIGLVMMVKKVLEESKFGTTLLVLEGPPPAVGGRVTGVLQVPNASVQPGSVTVKLTCNSTVRVKQKNGGEGKAETPVMQRKLVFPARRSVSGFTCAIALDIPDVPEMRERLGGHMLSPEVSLIGEPVFSWVLNVSTDTPGVDLDRNFPLTVLPLAPGSVPPPQPAPAAAPAAHVPLPPQAVSIAAQAEKTEPAAGPKAEPVSYTSGFVLVAVNLVPIAGVAFWGWKVGDIVMLYWMENLVIGVMNVMRILAAQPEIPVKMRERGIDVSGVALLGGKLVLCAFFIVHYGGFCLVHGAFLVDFFPAPGGRRGELWATVRAVLSEPGMLIAVGALVASHVFSFFHNFIGKGEYHRSKELVVQMFRPYGRILVVHFFVIVGGFLALAFKSQLLPTLFFVALKVGVDFHMHRRERELLGEIGTH